MVDIQVDALSAFKKNVAAFRLNFLKPVFHFSQIGHKTRSQRQQFFANGGFVQGIKFVQIAQQGVLFLQSVRHFGAQQGRIGQVASPQAHARGLVFVTGADAASGGADLVGGALGFAGFVQALVVGHDEVGLFTDAKPGRRNVNALGSQMVHFFKEHKGVEHYAIADEAHLAVMQNAGGNEVQNGFFALNLDGVPGIVAALKTDNGPALGAQHVNDFALAFVAPLCADDDRISHDITCLKRRGRGGVLS